jgi:VanZ family protein
MMQSSNKIRSILLIAIPVASALALFVPFEIQYNHSFWSRIFDAGHVPLFFVATMWIYVALGFASMSAQSRPLASFLLSTVVAGLVEVLQPYFGRSAELGDWVNGALGSFLAALLFIVIEHRTKLLAWFGYGFVSAVICTFSLFPAYQTYRAANWREDSFPLISSFEKRIELYLWSAVLEKGHSASALFERSTENAVNGEYSLYVKTFENKYSGVSLDTGRLNLEDAVTFELSVYNPGEHFELTIRIDDDGPVSDYQERFNKLIPIKHGHTDILIPVSSIKRGGGMRELDISAIRRIIFFVGKEKNSKEFYLDNLRVTLKSSD